MRKLLAVALALVGIWCLHLGDRPARGQFLGIVSSGKIATSTCDATHGAAGTFLARTSGLSGTETTAYTNMICGMISDGVGCSAWSGSTGNLDIFYFLATNTTTTANLNLCSSSFTLTPSNTPTFNADQGYTGNASNMKLDTGFSSASGGSYSSTTSASIGFYDRTLRATSDSYVQVGAVTGGQFDYCTSNFQNLDGVSFGAPSGTLVASSQAQGQFVCTRNAGNVQAYKNGNSTPFVNAAQTIGSAPAATITLLTLSSTNFTSDQLSAAFAGGGLNSTQATAIASRINAAMTALGTNVY
jgi:hypothetical protein